MPTAQAATTVAASNSSVNYYENDDMYVDPGLNITGSESTYTSAKVYIADGYVSGQDYLEYDTTNGISKQSFDSATGILTLTGSGNAAAYQAAFRNVRYNNTNENPNTEDRIITFVLGGNTLYFEDTGHYYESVYSSSAISWTSAKSAAASRSLEGMQGYLATITSAEENAFLGSKVSADAWIGASDATAEGASEGNWKWVTGPENGTTFWNNGNIEGVYNNWASGEPNNADVDDEYEHYAHMYGNQAGKYWNDYPNSNVEVYYYLVEYGGMEGDATPQLTTTVTVHVNSVNDAPTKPGEFTSPTSGQVKQGGNSLTVEWGTSSDVEEDSVTYDLWFFNGTWSLIDDLLDTNSKAFTLPEDNNESAMFRVYANDTKDNSSARDVTFTIDSSAPILDISGNPSTWQNTSAEISVSVTDVSTQSVKWASGIHDSDYFDSNGTSINSPYSFTATSNGNYTVYAIDDFGFNNLTTFEVTKVDKDDPSVVFVNTGNSTYNNSHSTTVTAIDETSEVQNMEYSWNQENNEESVSSWTEFTSGEILTNDSVNGGWYLHIRATDDAGNINHSISNVFNFDNTPPVINDVEHRENVNTGDTVEIEFNVSDNIEVTSTDFNISTNASAELTKNDNWYNYTLDVPEESLDDIDFNATFYDDAGNFNESDDKTINVSDDIDPVIQYIVSEKEVNTGDVTEIAFNVSDNIGVNNSLTEFNITGNTSAELTQNDNWYNYTLDVPVDSVDDIDFNATFYDDAGNFNESDDKTINVSDDIDPVIQYIVSEKEVNTGDVTEIAFNVSDNIGVNNSLTEFNITGNTSAELTQNDNWYNYTLDVPVDSVDDIDFNATFYDDAGNFNASDDMTINVSDNIVPVIQDIVYEEDVNTSDTVEIGFNVTDNIGVNHSLTEFNITGNASAELTRDGNWYNYTLVVPEKSVQDIVFNATFYDDAGNFNASDDMTINVSDNIKPAYDWSDKVISANTSENITIKLNATDNIGVELYNITVDGEEYQMENVSGNYTHNISIPASDSGTLVSSITYNCTFGDAAGNINSTGDLVIDVSILPIADFSANVTRGTAPLSVEFTDNSSGLVENWNWDFGDGNTSTDQNPSHVFGAGNFTVNLTVNNGNATSSKELNIRAAEEPEYSLSTDDTELVSTHGEERNLSINTTLNSSFEWYINGEPLNGTGVTLYNNNTDDSAQMSYCNINTSQYIDQEDFFMNVSNISVHVSNESLGRTDVFSWEWTVTNSSAEDADDIDQIINTTPEVNKSGNESNVHFNTSNQISNKT
ncbi:PKD domain-containing protein, partial [Methanohalophilus sp.]